MADTLIKRWCAAEELLTNALTEMRALCDTPEDAAKEASNVIHTWLKFHGSEAEDDASREANVSSQQRI